MKIYTTTLLLLLMLSCHQDKVKKVAAAKNPYYDKAREFLKNNNADSSFIYFNKAKERFLKDGDSVKVAKCLVNMAIISGGKGDFFGSQEISLSAISYLNPAIEDQKEILSSNYNNLGKMANRLKNYQQATGFFTRSIGLTNKEASKNIYLNNLAMNLTDQHEYAGAVKYFKRLLATQSIKENPVTFSRILSNSAKTKWLQNPDYNPLPEFLAALKIREQGHDLWGQNASLAHLTDFYLDKKPDSALFYAHRMYRIAQNISSAEDRVYALERMIELSQPGQSKQYFDIYKNLKDSLETERNAAKNQFALIRYETEKNKADNLVLQKDNADKRYQINKQKFFLILGTVFIVSGMVIFALWYRKRKQKLELEASAAIRENKLKIYKKIHDVVANGLYTMMSEMEDKEDLDREKVLDGIEVLYEKSRNLSYEDHPPADSDFALQINRLMASFGHQNRRVSLVGNEEALWNQVSPNVKYEIEHVLQELMVNMKKHSGAGNVVVKFTQTSNQIYIDYTDDGVGIQGTPKFNNGLTNTVSRIKSICGDVNFGTKNNKGLSVHISFPVT